MHNFKYDICVIGGGGHVGLPLSLLFADKGKKVVINDTNIETVNKIKAGVMPFMEDGAEDMLKRNIGKNLSITDNLEVISESRHIVVVIGTPVDEHLNPEFDLMVRVFESFLPYLKDGQSVILRSTVYPGTTEKIYNFLNKKGLKIKVAFCPERIAQGKSMEETRILPQIISSFDHETTEEMKQLFSIITEDSIVLSPLEAELGKLFTNSWRYIEFAAANQYYTIASNFGVDFYKIFDAIKYKYPRAAHFSSAGFSAGPCLFKDTMQISSFNNNNFPLGQAAMFVNEGMPNLIVQKLKEKFDLENKKVGILGMAFKANCDDKRESLAYKLKKILKMEADKVYCSDVYIQDDGFLQMQEVIDKSDIIVIGCPHREYKHIILPQDKTLIDIWNFVNN